MNISSLRLVFAAAVLASISVTGFVEAAKTPVTKTDWMANAKQTIEARGKTFDSAHMSASFDKMDLNNDGIFR
jgi:hypothetical protein